MRLYLGRRREGSNAYVRVVIIMASSCLRQGARHHSPENEKSNVQRKQLLVSAREEQCTKAKFSVSGETFRREKT